MSSFDYENQIVEYIITKGAFIQSLQICRKILKILLL